MWLRAFALCIPTLGDYSNNDAAVFTITIRAASTDCK